jgi:hypothetical protein
LCAKWKVVTCYPYHQLQGSLLSFIIYGTKGHIALNVQAIYNYFLSIGLVVTEECCPITWVYIWVVLKSLCPNSSCTVLMSAPFNNSCVAKLCLLCRARHSRHYVPFLIMSCRATISWFYWQTRK